MSWSKLCAPATRCSWSSWLENAQCWGLGCLPRWHGPCTITFPAAPSATRGPDTLCRSRVVSAERVVTCFRTVALKAGVHNMGGSGARRPVTVMSCSLLIQAQSRGECRKRRKRRCCGMRRRRWPRRTGSASSLRPRRARPRGRRSRPRQPLSQRVPLRRCSRGEVAGAAGAPRRLWGRGMVRGCRSARSPPSAQPPHRTPKR